MSYKKHDQHCTILILDLQMRGGQYAPGFNTDCGDKWMDILMKFWGYDSHAFEVSKGGHSD